MKQKINIVKATIKSIHCVHIHTFLDLADCQISTTEWIPNR